MGSGTKKAGISASKEKRVQSLAVAVRPPTLDALIGQDAIVSQIRGMMKSKRGRIPGTFLIIGPTGTGKTTISRLIARYLNCRSPTKEGDPCGECLSCKYTENHPDIMEENLANTRGIDDIRGMISSAKNMPTLGNFRVYILDEFHQITTAAANALLKMLEEPPPHTVWILATTNPEKILGTIYGRALKLKTQPISEEILCKCLYQIAKKEGFDLKDIKDYKDILKTIYQVCEGRPREAISLLESLLFSLEGGSKATAKDVIKTFMQTSDAEVEQLAADLIYAVISGNLKQAMTAILASKGNIRQLVSKARWLIHNVVCDLTGQQGFNTYGKRLLATKIRDSGGKVKIKLPIIINFQYQLCSLEKDLNYMSIDEVVMATAYIGNFLTQPRPPQSNGQP